MGLKGNWHRKLCRVSVNTYLQIARSACCVTHLVGCWGGMEGGRVDQQTMPDLGPYISAGTQGLTILLVSATPKQLWNYLKENIDCNSIKNP